MFRGIGAWNPVVPAVAGFIVGVLAVLVYIVTLMIA